jgi:hypothetical protein
METHCEEITENDPKYYRALTLALETPYLPLVDACSINRVAISIRNISTEPISVVLRFSWNQGDGWRE